MIYPYACPKGHRFEVIKPLSAIDNEERCECGEVSERQIGLTRLDKTSAGGWNQQSYNPALGQWTKSTKHARDIAKAKGLIEVGNEPPENIHKHFDKQREETRTQRYEDALRDKVYS